MKIPCQKCNKLVLESFLKQYDGICITCGRKELNVKKQQETQDKLNLQKEQAVELICTKEEENLFNTCQVYCMFDCCGFNALDTSTEQLEKSVDILGKKEATKALNSLKNNINLMKNHMGLIKTTYGDYESAEEFRNEYQKAYNNLKQILKNLT